MSGCYSPSWYSLRSRFLRGVLVRSHGYSCSCSYFCLCFFSRFKDHRLVGSDSLTSVLKTGLVTQANGSAYIEAEGVKIACSA